jgi:hypothetical protein
MTNIDANATPIPGDQDSESRRKVSPRLPVALLFRWSLSGALILVGVWHLFLLLRSWSYWSERIVIDAAYSPYPWLIVELCVLLAGILLAIRSRWVFVPVLIHIALFARQMHVGGGFSFSGASIPFEIFQVWFIEAVVLGECIRLWSKRGLR